MTSDRALPGDAGQTDGGFPDYEVPSMWLPAPLYENAPQYWLAVGLGLLVVGTWLGLEIRPLLGYVGVASGTLCCLWSLVVQRRRIARRANTATTQAGDGPGR